MNIYGKLFTKLNMLRRSNTMTKKAALSVWLLICKSLIIIHSVIKIEDRSHVIISIDAEKAFYIVHMISILEKLEIKRIFQIKDHT